MAADAVYEDGLKTSSVIRSSVEQALAALVGPARTGYDERRLQYIIAGAAAGAGIFVSLRMMLYELKPEDLTPPYWVSMGACAITVLAGARIVEMAEAPMVEATRGLVAGTSVVFWAFATWLIPVLVAAGSWRHGYHRIPLTYEATLWSIVFPLGMYAVAGIYLGRADHLPIVHAIGRVELWFAFSAWLISGIAMVKHVVSTVLLPDRAT